MSTPLPIINPICQFICGPPDPSDPTVGQCHIFCETVKNCAITPNIAYVLFNNLLFGGRDLFTGAIEVLRGDISSLALTVGIYQQLPWFILFILLVFVLAYSGVIGGLTAIVLILTGGVLIALFIYLSYHEVTTKMPTIIQNASNRFWADYEASREEVTDRITLPLINAFNQSNVPCDCGSNGEECNSCTSCSFTIRYTGDIDAQISQVKFALELYGGTLDPVAMTYTIPPIPDLNLPAIAGTYSINRSASTISFVINSGLSPLECTIVRGVMESLVGGSSMNQSIVRARDSRL